MNESAKKHWLATRKLMFTVLAVWFVFGYLIHAFVGSLNSIAFLGFPLGFYFAAQGSLIIFVLLNFWFGRRQEAIDRDHGFAEDT